MHLTWCMGWFIQIVTDDLIEFENDRLKFKDFRKVTHLWNVPHINKEKPKDHNL